LTACTTQQTLFLSLDLNTFNVEERPLLVILLVDLLAVTH